MDATGVMPGLVPGTHQTLAPVLELRWIPATPAFAGAGKCRDDEVAT
jgi:hypothetical protein